MSLPRSLSVFTPWSRSAGTPSLSGMPAAANWISRLRKRKGILNAAGSRIGQLRNEVPCDSAVLATVPCPAGGGPATGRQDLPSVAGQSEPPFTAIPAAGGTQEFGDSANRKTTTGRSGSWNPEPWYGPGLAPTPNMINWFAVDREAYPRNHLRLGPGGILRRRRLSQ